MNYRERVGQNIEYYRKTCGLTLKDLAERVGITEATMQKYEKGQIKRIDVDMCQKIATALDTTPECITGWLNKEDQSKAHNERIQQRLTKYTTAFEMLSFEKQKLVYDYMKHLDSGVQAMPLSKAEVAFINKYRLIDDSYRQIINNTLETAYNVYLGSEKEQQTTVS